MCDGLDWGSVGYPGNPVPGDSGGTDALAGKLRSASVAFSGMSDSLRCLSGSNGLKGRYADQLRAKTDGFAPDFAKLAASLSAASGEMGGWSSEMDSHQRAARAAYDQIVAAQQAASNWADSMRSLPSRVDNTAMDMKAYAPGAPGADPDKYAQAKKAHDAARKRLDELTHQQAVSQADADAAKRALDRVVAAYNADADKHRRKIDTAYNDLPSLKWYESLSYSDEWEAAVKVARVASIGLIFITAPCTGGLSIAASFLVGGVLLANDVLEGADGDLKGADLWLSLAGDALTIGDGFLGLADATKGIDGLRGMKALAPSKTTEEFLDATKVARKDLAEDAMNGISHVHGQHISADPSTAGEDFVSIAKDTWKTWGTEWIDRVMPTGAIKAGKHAFEEASKQSDLTNMTLKFVEVAKADRLVNKTAKQVVRWGGVVNTSVKNGTEHIDATVEYIIKKFFPIVGFPLQIGEDLHAGQ